MITTTTAAAICSSLFTAVLAGIADVILPSLLTSERAAVLGRIRGWL